MKVHQTTIKDIARILSISPSTVSRALKDHPDISEETKQAVCRVAKSVNYRPNALALSLRRAKTNIIGVVVPEMSHFFFSAVLSGMDSYAFSRGYTTMICQSGESADHEQKVLQSLIDSRVDGILISLSKETCDGEFLSHLVGEGMPVVMFDRPAEDVEASSVTTDDYQGAHDAVALMVGGGRRRIALLCGDDGLTVSRRRREGYEMALREAGIEVDASLILVADTPEKLGEKGELFRRMASDIDGLFAINDQVAVQAMRILRSMGLGVPKDVEVVGFGDGPLASVVEPSLTSVHQNGFEMGRMAMEILIDQIEGGLIVSRPIVKVLKSEVVVRESTGGAR